MLSLVRTQWSHRKAESVLTLAYQVLANRSRKASRSEVTHLTEKAAQVAKQTAQQPGAQ
jgi:hypothetical protein